MIILVPEYLVQQGQEGIEVAGVVLTPNLLIQRGLSVHISSNL